MKKLLKLIGVIIAIASGAAVLAYISERKEEKKAPKAKLPHKPYGIYEQYIKRPLDCFLSTGALIVLSPVLLVLTVVGAVEMQGNPFFTQERPGKDEKIFKLIKFRTMNNKKDKDGNLLPDEERLTKYGKFLRSTSLDELPELFNILKGDMSIIGPRPLLVEYLPWYTKDEQHRHDVRPGLTGWAQVNGRNNLEWDKRLQLDLYYVKNISLFRDIQIILLTAKKVISRSDISSNTAVTEGNLAQIRKKKGENENEYSNSQCGDKK